jgi:hypothetical protein
LRTTTYEFWKALFTDDEAHPLPHGLERRPTLEPYRHKATVLRIVKGLPHKRTMTPWGFGYAVSAADIKAYNKR